MTLQQLFEQWAGEPCRECLALGANGSNRKYYRLLGDTHRCIGAENDDVRENEAFFAYSRHFKAQGINVPELYAVSDCRTKYIQQDLGDQTLYGLLYEKKQQGGGFDSEMLSLYKQALTDLAQIQEAGRNLDFSVAYPRSDFDLQSILWDLNYFKYYFLKLAYIPFDENLLELDFRRFADYLLQADCHYFLYRDFNPRNIMLSTTNSQQPTLYYIDYQGGRRGAAQYDVASILYSAKSDLPEAVRQELLRHYLSVSHVPDFMQYFWGYVLVRIMQTMGAYGYRGYYERKPYFLQSIPLAVNNLRYIVENHPLPIRLPELERVWQSIVKTLPSTTCDYPQPTTDTLTVTVSSFSYKKGLPDDPSGNGGGFVFDCRALPNPGRYPEYKTYTGKDRPVIEFLQREPAVDQFLSHVEGIVGQSVEKYMERHFTNLSVAFGCTGGQHRSVYCAEQLAKWLSKQYSCRVVVCHREQD